MKLDAQLLTAFPVNYQISQLESAPLVHPLEALYHFPLELEEGDRAGAYARVVPRQGPAWSGFFALGFNSEQVVNAVCACPDPDSVCVIVGGYAYVVKVTDPANWFQVEQRPVVDLRVAAEAGLLLFAGFTSVTAVGKTGIAWQSEQLSWEGLRITRVEGGKLHGFGWEVISDQEVPFEVELKTGKHAGGAKPAGFPSRRKGT